MRPTPYADRSRRQPTALPKPRNIGAVDRAREQDVPLVISFVGDSHLSNPTVFCDAGKRYDWSFIDGFLTIILFKPGMDLKDALPEILKRTDVIGRGYPVLLDVERKQAACVIEGTPVGFWQMRPDSELCQSYFAPPT